MEITSYCDGNEIIDITSVVNDIVKRFKSFTSVVYRLDKCIERLELHDNSVIEVLGSVEAYLSSSDFGPQQLEQLLKDINEVHKDALANLASLQDTKAYLTQAKNKKSKLNAENVSILLPFISKARINANELPSFISRAKAVTFADKVYGKRAVKAVINTVNIGFKTIAEMNAILASLPLPKDDKRYEKLPENESEL